MNNNQSQIEEKAKASVAVGKQKNTNRKSEVLLKNQRRLFAVNGLYSFLRLETHESETKSPKRKLSHETPKAAPITETKLAKFYNHAIQSHTSPSSSVCYTSNTQQRQRNIEHERFCIQ